MKYVLCPRISAMGNGHATYNVGATLMRDLVDWLERELKKADIEIGGSFERVLQSNLVDIEPWRFLSYEEAQQLQEGMRRRYGNRSVLPFSRRDDNDDVVCFIFEDKQRPAGSVIIVHDFASPGFEVVAEFNGFDDWFWGITRVGHD